MIKVTKQKNRILCLVLTNSSDPWKTIYEEGAKTTWVKDAFNVMTVHSYTGKQPGLIDDFRERITGRLRHTKFSSLQSLIDTKFQGIFKRYPKKQYLRDGNIFQDEIELHSTIGIRTLSAFEFMLGDPNWDFLWRANVSNYVHVPKLIATIEGLPKQNLAAGVINFFGSTPYLSGAGYLLSRDVVVQIVENAKYWNNNFLDDVALGFVLEELKVPLYPLERLSITNRSDLANFTNHELSNYASFRCNGLHDRMQDILIMKELHRRLCGE